nr:hypothetical protein [Micromonospora sp. BL4]
MVGVVVLRFGHGVDSCGESAGREGSGEPWVELFEDVVLADYLNRARGTLARRENVVICSGYGQGVALLLQVLAARGARRLAVEDPSADDDVRPVAAAAGLEVIGVPVGPDGILVEELEQTDADAVVLTPSHQWPRAPWKSTATTCRRAGASAARIRARPWPRALTSPARCAQWDGTATRVPIFEETSARTSACTDPSMSRPSMPAANSLEPMSGRGRAAEAAMLHEINEALHHAEAAGTQVMWWPQYRAAAYSAAGRHGDAIALLRSLVEQAEAALPRDNPSSIRLRLFLARALPARKPGPAGTATVRASGAGPGADIGRRPHRVAERAPQPGNGLCGTRPAPSGEKRANGRAGRLHSDAG